MKHIKAIFVILFLLLIVIVAAQNIPNLEKPVVFKLNLWFFEYQTPNIPLGFVAVVAFMIGVLSMGFLGIVERFQMKKQIKALHGEVRELDKELNSLRTTAVTPEVVNFEQTSEM